MLPVENVAVDFITEDAEEELQLSVGQLRGRMRRDSIGSRGVSDRANDTPGCIFLDRQSVAHDVGDEHHLDNLSKEFSKLQNR